MHRHITWQPNYLAEQRAVHDIHAALETNNQGRLATALVEMHEHYSQASDKVRILVAAEVGIPPGTLLKGTVDREIKKIEETTPAAKRHHAPIRRLGLEVRPPQKTNFPVLSRA